VLGLGCALLDVGSRPNITDKPDTLDKLDSPDKPDQPDQRDRRNRPNRPTRPHRQERYRGQGVACRISGRNMAAIVRGWLQNNLKNQ